MSLSFSEIWNFYCILSDLIDLSTEAVQSVWPFSPMARSVIPPWWALHTCWEAGIHKRPTTGCISSHCYLRALLDAFWIATFHLKQ